MTNLDFIKGETPNKVYLLTSKAQLAGAILTENEKFYIQSKLDRGTNLIMLNHFNEWFYVAYADQGKEEHLFLEECRRRGNEINNHLRKEKLSTITLTQLHENIPAILALAEGLALGSYDFSKYLTKNGENNSDLKQIYFSNDWVPEEKIQELSIIVDAVFKVRDMINEPVTFLNAEKLAERFEAMGREAGFKTEIFDKEKIEALKMGGLLGVNRGSIDPPTFSVLEWHPSNASNEKPIILVGKGVTYDTGGLSLKPTPNSMDYMKSDMAGGATVAAVVYAAARLKLPLYLMAFIPATDNRPDGNALTPGDIIFMHNGKSVEVLNTDAEGRLILADALSYAKNFNPSLVIDAATLTGAAAMAIGSYGIVAMGNANRETFDKLKESGEQVYERIVEFPFWDEYSESLKSDIADMKNIGAREGGAINAGKFLSNFVDYPWIHLDIAGPAFLQKADQYRPKGGTGTGLRLLLNFIKNYI